MFSDATRCVVIVGAQWGDEGKGKITDVLAEQATLVARWQGGANAGHTVLVDGEEFILHLIPSGALYPDVRCVLGNGVVVDPWTLREEIQMLTARGIDVEGRLGVSRRAHLVLPYHKLVDGAREASRGEAKIGTTKRGIGPAYRDKASRTGLRVCDLEDLAYCRAVLIEETSAANALLEHYGVPERADAEGILASLEEISGGLLAMGVDSGDEIRAELAAGGRILLEGAQGSLLDVDHGTYPYVTSSNTTAGAACAGLGIAPRLVDEIVGVAKAYTTRVGNGPMPTELRGEEAERLRNLGAEFGATTGRPRRPGWFDGVVVGHAVRVNGLTSLAVTKLDVLDSFPSLQLALRYEVDGEESEHFPERAATAERARPVYETLAGWESETGGARAWDELPANARDYLRRIEEVAGTPLRLISVGSSRDQIVRLG